MTGFARPCVGGAKATAINAEKRQILIRIGARLLDCATTPATAKELPQTLDTSADLRSSRR